MRRVVVSKCGCCCCCCGGGGIGHFGRMNIIIIINDSRIVVVVVVAFIIIATSLHPTHEPPNAAYHEKSKDRTDDSQSNRQTPLGGLVVSNV